MNSHYVVSVLRTSAFTGNPHFLPAASVIMLKISSDRSYSVASNAWFITSVRNARNNIGLLYVKLELSVQHEQSIKDGSREAWLVCLASDINRRPERFAPLTAPTYTHQRRQFRWRGQIGSHRQGCNEGRKEGTIPRAPNHCGERRVTAWSARKSQQCHKYFPHTVHQGCHIEKRNRKLEMHQKAS